MLPPHCASGPPINIGAAEGGSQRSERQRNIELVNSRGVTPMIVNGRSFTRSTRPIAAESAPSRSRQKLYDTTVTALTAAESEAVKNRPSSGRISSIEK